MPRSRKPVPEDDEGQVTEPVEQALGALEEFLSAVVDERGREPQLQARAVRARQAVARARTEWWRMGLEVHALRQRVEHMEGEVARLERFVGKLTSSLEESEWVTGA